MLSNFTAIALLLIIVVAVILGPFIAIWALNTLFPILAIPYALETWAAIIAINATLRGIFYNIKVSK